MVLNGNSATRAKIVTSTFGRARWRKLTQGETMGGGSRLVGEVSTHAIFEVTYTDGTVEEIEAQECLEMGQHFTLVNYRVLFVWTVYTEIVRRLDRRAVVRVDEVMERSVIRG